MAKPASETKKILVPIDGSETSLRAASHALSLARESKGSITLLHVSEIPPLPLHGDDLNKYSKEVSNEAEEWFNKIKNFPEGKSVEVKTKVLTGAKSVVDTIVKFAKDEDVDTIVIGTKGRSKVSKLLLGSVASGVKNNATCQVILIK